MTQEEAINALLQDIIQNPDQWEMINEDYWDYILRHKDNTEERFIEIKSHRLNPVLFIHFADTYGVSTIDPQGEDLERCKELLGLFPDLKHLSWKKPGRLLNLLHELKERQE